MYARLLTVGIAPFLGVGLAQATPAPLSSAPIPWVRPTPTPVVWDGAPAVQYTATLEPLDLSPEGEARVLVRVRFVDAKGKQTHLLRGGDFEFVPSRGEAQWQTRLRYGGPAAIVRVRTAGSLDLRVIAKKPAGLGTVRAHLDAALLPKPGSLARAIGPYEIQVGVFPQIDRGTVTIERTDAANRRRVVRFAAPFSTFRDTSVAPMSRYRYRIQSAVGLSQTIVASATGELPLATSQTVTGIGAWLAFSGSARDDDAYTRVDPERTISTAKRSGLRYIMLRMTYGEFWQITPEAKATIDRLIDRAADAGIAMLAWTVPREASAEDVAANVAALAYRTPSGHGMSGLAVDLERGEEFLGSGPRGYRVLKSYLGRVRSAVGPRVLLVATVEDPYLEKLDQRTFPYREIARDANVMQPMAYWRMLRKSSTDAQMRDAILGSVRTLRLLSGRPAMPINIGGQTVALSPSGGPPPTELAASVEVARSAGAIGETLYALTGTTAAQWDAIGRTTW